MTLPPATLPLFASLSLAQGPSSVGSPAHILWGLLAAGLMLLWWRERRQGQQLAQEHARAAKAIKQAKSVTTKATKDDLEAAKGSLKTAEIALAAQKKKNFAQSEQLQTAKDAAQDAQRRAEEAIADAQRARREAEAVLVANADKPSRGASRRGHRAYAKAESPAPVAVNVAPADDFTSAAVEAVVQALAEPAEAHASGESEAEASGETEAHPLALALAEAEATCAEGEAERRKLMVSLKEARRELGRKDKRLEDLRRVDLMSRGKIEVLEDKVKRLGRELYESISVIAQLKGDVGPVPKSRPKKPAPSPQHGHPEGLANGHAKSDSRALSSN